MVESKHSGCFPSASFSLTVLNFVVNGEQMVGLCSPPFSSCSSADDVAWKKKTLVVGNQFSCTKLRVSLRVEGRAWICHDDEYILPQHNFTGHTHNTHIFFVFREEHATEYEFDQIWLEQCLLFYYYSFTLLLYSLLPMLYLSPEVENALRKPNSSDPNFVSIQTHLSLFPVFMVAVCFSLADNLMNANFLI